MLKLFSPPMKGVIGYMSLTYSMTALLIVLGLSGKLLMAADVAIVQGAVLATFYVLSGDARHLILSNQSRAPAVLFFRLVWVLPLAGLSYLMTMAVSEVNHFIVCALLLRRSTEWLAEVHATEIERKNEGWSGFYLQPIMFGALVAQILLTNETWMIWIWSLSPILFSVRFILNAERCSIFNIKWEYIISTAVIGFTGYLYRVLIVSIAGKEFSGMLFPGFAIGSFVGSMAANVAGPTLLNRSIVKSKLVLGGLILWTMSGAVIFCFSHTILYKTIGLSIVGGTMMILAQQSRLLLLRGRHTLELDLILHLTLIFSVPAIVTVLGVEWLSAYYLIGALLAWIFYSGCGSFDKIGGPMRTGVLVIIVLGIISPIFVTLSGHLYNTFLTPLIDSGGNLRSVPLPLSIFACCLGLIMFSTPYHQSKSIVLTITAMFLAMIVSVMLSNQGFSKLLLLIQYILPTMALLLGVALAIFNTDLITKTVVAFLTVFVPSQLIMTWIQGQLALTHYMYAFSVYQHYQYVPVIIVGLYMWAWVDLRQKSLKWIYFLTPWTGMYVAAGNSTLALFGFLAFTFCFAWAGRRRKTDLLIPCIALLSIIGYFCLNAHIAVDIKNANKSNHLVRHGIFVEKFFNSNGQWRYGGDVPENVPENIPENVPENVYGRYQIALMYITEIRANPMSLLIGNAAPPAREKISSAHNYYLDIVYNFGILSCLPILILLLYTMRNSWLLRSKDASLLWLAAILLFFVFIDSNLKVTLRQPYPGIVIFFLWGILLARINASGSTPAITDQKIEKNIDGITIKP